MANTNIARDRRYGVVGRKARDRALREYLAVCKRVMKAWLAWLNEAHSQGSRTLEQWKFRLAVLFGQWIAAEADKEAALEAYRATCAKFPAL
jgi:hypothetical protein